MSARDVKTHDTMNDAKNENVNMSSESLLPTEAFDVIEQDFRKVLQQLSGDESLKTFRSEYEKLHNALRKSHENETRLIDKCRELNSEILSNASKVHTAMRLSQEDQNNIALLKKEIDKAWKMVDTAHEKEKRAKLTTQQLKQEIKTLSQLVDKGAGLTLGHENTVADLMADKEKLLLEMQHKDKITGDQEQRLHEMESEIDEMVEQRENMNSQTTELNESLNRTRSENEREKRRSHRLQEEMLSVKELADRRELDNQQLEANIDQCKLDNDTLRTIVKENKSNLEKFRRVGDDLRIKNDDYERRIQEFLLKQQKNAEEKESIVAEVRAKNEIIRKKVEEITQYKKKQAKTEKTMGILHSQKGDIEQQRNHYREELVSFGKALDQQKHIAVTDDKIICELESQLKRLDASFNLSKEKNRMQGEITHTHKEVKKNLENEILIHKKTEEKMLKENHLIEVQHEKAALTATTWHKKYEETGEIVKLKDMENNELQKKLIEEKNKLKLQQTLYESVRADRNKFNQQHIEARDETAEMKRKFKIMTHQIDQLKEEIAAKDAAVIQQHFEVKSLQEEMKSQRKHMNKKDSVLETADQLLASQDIEVKNLRHTLVEAEHAQKQQKKVYDDVVGERDVLGAQLIRRNDELALLYEKVKIQQSILRKGESQYQERLDDVNELRSNVSNMERKVALRDTQLSSMETLSQEVHRLHRELLQERTKVKALSEELENPMNVHRWRKLEGNDPNAYEMLQKIQTLQKRLILKTEEVVEKDLFIQEKVKLCNELKNILTRQPGPEVVEQLSVYQQTLKEKTKQMKAMAAELNMFSVQVSEYKHEIERLTRELQDMKRKYFEQKRREQLEREAQRGEEFDANDPLVKQQNQFGQHQQKFVGGGFNLNAI